MAYSFQTFSVGQVLTAAQVNQIEVNVRDHVHGAAGVSTAGMTFTGTTQAETLQASAPQNTLKALSCYLLPSMNDGCRGYLRAGFDWWSRNQQWGGPFGFSGLVDGATGVAYNGEAATGYIDASAGLPSFGYDATNDKLSQGFKLPETQSLKHIYVKLTKTGDPATSARVFIYSDAAGSPSALVTNGTAIAISGKLITSDITGAVYRFEFPTPPTLTGGTQYHLVLDASGLSTTNYFNWIAKTGKTYPFGHRNTGTSAPAWTPTTTTAFWFLVELSASAQTLQSGGQFDDKLQFGGSGASGTLSMSRGLCSTVPLHELVDTTEGTIYLVGTALTKDATFLDIGYGEDHDRIVLRSNVTTGYLQGNVYESGGTNTAVTATATDLSSGTHSIGIYWRAKNDGADRIDIFVDGVTYSSATNLSLDFDALMAKLGTMWVGGGFALAPTYLGVARNGFSGLPSTLTPAWTYNGTATEGSHFSVSGGKLLGNKNASGSTDTSNFSIAWTGVNATGTDSQFELQVVSNTNTKDNGGCAIDHDDGTKRVLSYHQEYYSTAAALFYPQGDGKSFANVIHTAAKLTDFFQFTNRRLTVDGSNAAAATSANRIAFGDLSATASENADATYSAAQYLVTGWNPPQFTSGSISELAIWQGNMKALWPLLYNGGTFVSVKALLGVPGNYLDKSAKIPDLALDGITDGGTSTSAYTIAKEMEAFAVGERLTIASHSRIYPSTNGFAIEYGAHIDGVCLGTSTITGTASYSDVLASNCSKQSYLGLHKVHMAFKLASGTATEQMLARGNRLMSVKREI